jgi:cellobiose-specific phosphotransferase system component IIC
VFVCFAIGYDLGKRLKQEAIKASMATLVFLMIQIEMKEQALMDVSPRFATAIIIALITVRSRNSLPTKLRHQAAENVPPVRL